MKIIIVPEGRSQFSAAPPKTLDIPAKRLWAALVAAVLCAAFVLFAAARSIAAGWLENKSPQARALVQELEKRQNAEQRRILKEERRAANAQFAELRARIAELRARGIILAERVGLAGDEVFVPPAAFAAAPGEECGGFPKPDAAETAENNTDNTESAAAETTAANNHAPKTPNAAPAKTSPKNNNGEKTANPAKTAPQNTAENNTAAAANAPAPPHKNGESLAALARLNDDFALLNKRYNAILRHGAVAAVTYDTVPLVRPLRGRNWLSSRFGMRRDPITGRRAFHAGYDYAARRGVPVLAAAAGRIDYAGRLGNYGKAVRISHGQNISTLYGHLHSFSVKPGQYVRRGEVIGKVGNTGRSTGPHLHYEVRVNNRPRPVANAINKIRRARAVPEFWAL